MRLFPANILICEGDSLVRRDTTTPMGFKGEWIIVPKEDFDAARKLFTDLQDAIIMLSRNVDAEDDYYRRKAIVPEVNQLRLLVGLPVLGTSTL